MKAGLKIIFSYSMLLFTVACGETATERAERQLQELNTWVILQEPKIETATEAEWQQINAQFVEKLNELQEQETNLSDSGKTALEKLEIKFYDWGNRNKQYQQIEQQRQQDSVINNLP